MEKLWMAPAGLHIEPAELRDADPIARLHAAGFYRGWPRGEFSAYLAEPARTPAYLACDGKRKICFYRKNGLERV